MRSRIVSAAATNQSRSVAADASLPRASASLASTALLISSTSFSSASAVARRLERSAPPVWFALAGPELRANLGLSISVLPTRPSVCMTPRRVVWLAELKRVSPKVPPAVPRSARCCRKRGGRQIGDHPEKHFADFGISRPLSGLSALLGVAQVLGGFRTHGAASVDVHSGTSHMCGSLPHPRPLYALVRPHCVKLGHCS